MGIYVSLIQQDNRPTLAEWPIRIWNMDEFPVEYKSYAAKWMKKEFSEYQFVFVPKRKACKYSFTYMFGYGVDEILYLKECDGNIHETVLNRRDIISVKTFRELLNIEIQITYRSSNTEKQLVFPYVPSTYYLYDPFLNWTLGLEKEFVPSVIERDYPRLQKLYEESLVMYNGSLHAYRLGNGFLDYEYRYEKYRPKWTPWKVKLKEWLEISMERGTFQLYSFGYITECNYVIKGKVK